MFGFGRKKAPEKPPEEKTPQSLFGRLRAGLARTRANLSDALGVPIRFIGVGEGIEDLRLFDADEFVKALFE